MADQDPDRQFDSASIGDRLREAREAKSMTLEEVATQTRIPIRHLQHIEREEWDALPATTYCVGFARAFANTIGLDGAAIARELREQLGGTRSRAPAPEYYEQADPARVPPKPVIIIVILAALILIAAYLLWRSTLDEAPEGAAVDLAVPEAQEPQTRKAPAQPTAQAQQPGSLSGQPVTLVATEEVWLRVSDGATSLFQGILQPGQRYSVPPTAENPVVRTGRPQVLRALVGNRDLGPLDPVERTVSNVSVRPEALAQGR